MIQPTQHVPTIRPTNIIQPHANLLLPPYHQSPSQLIYEVHPVLISLIQTVLCHYVIPKLSWQFPRQQKTAKQIIRLTSLSRILNQHIYSTNIPLINLLAGQKQTVFLMILALDFVYHHVSYSSGDLVSGTSSCRRCLVFRECIYIEHRAAWDVIWLFFYEHWKLEANKLTLSSPFINTNDNTNKPLSQI